MLDFLVGLDTEFSDMVDGSHLYFPSYVRLADVVLPAEQKQVRWGGGDGRCLAEWGAGQRACQVRIEGGGEAVAPTARSAHSGTQRS